MADKNKYKNSKEEIVKPSKSMMVDTTTGEGANIFLIEKDTKHKDPIYDKKINKKNKKYKKLKTKNTKFYGYTNIKKY